MDMPTDLAHAKATAKRLRADHAARGQQLSHSQALEHLAQACGHRNWNSLSAALAPEAPLRIKVGGQVSGRYLGQCFVAKVLAAKQVPHGWVSVKLELAEPVDVVRFDSFSSFRKRLRGTVGPKGHSRERTSNGEPHLVIDL